MKYKQCGKEEEEMINSLVFVLKSAGMKLRNLLTDEKGEVNIVATVVLIGIAVLLAIVFKDAIGKLIKDLLDAIKINGTKAVNDPI